MTTPRVLILCLCALLLGTAPATRAGLFSPPDWPELKAQIRHDYPGVRQLTVDELLTAQRIDAPLLLLDARSPEEFEVSHLQHARLASDARALQNVLADLPKDTRIVVYCSVGLRSAALALELQQRGFTRVANLEGSLFEWANRGLPLYRGDRQVMLVHPYNRKWGQLLRRELRAAP